MAAELPIMLLGEHVVIGDVLDMVCLRLPLPLCLRLTAGAVLFREGKIRLGLRYLLLLCFLLLGLVDVLPDMTGHYLLLVEVAVALPLRFLAVTLFLLLLIEPRSSLPGQVALVRDVMALENLHRGCPHLRVIGNRLLALHCRGVTEVELTSVLLPQVQAVELHRRLLALPLQVMLRTLNGLQDLVNHALIFRVEGFLHGLLLSCQALVRHLLVENGVIHSEHPPARILQLGTTSHLVRALLHDLHREMLIMGEVLQVRVDRP
mmetsp:Transcript_33758/g.76408  ORF Transcript_33758/g.76408 Transcript_33758/m.76408 type:complete len:263 (+) Transcript_33758:518-1306(+)